MSTLTISNKEVEDIEKIGKSLKDFGLLIKGISGTVENEAKEQKGEFLGMLLDTLSGSLLGNMLTGKKLELIRIFNTTYYFNQC